MLLLDGSTLRLRATTPQDLADIKAFYDALSPESVYLRFHGFPNVGLAARAHADAGGVDRVALIGRHGDRIVAAASYDLLREPGTAEVAFAVAEDFRRRGAATRMLEQLAEVGARRGIHRFDAEVLATNHPMLSVFEQAGFAVRRHGLGGEVTVSLDIEPTDATQERIDERDHIGAVASLKPILSPSSIAVVGGPGGPEDVAETVFARILAGGYRGMVSRVGDLVELDAPQDLVIAAVAPADVASVASSAARHGVRALLVLTGESEGDELEDVLARRDQLLENARSGGLRVIGPGSLGVLNSDPAVRLNATFAGASAIPGRLAVCSQSGAIGIALLGQAAARSIGVASFVALGDRIDVSTNDLLELWGEDERAAGVMLYVETFGNPEHFRRIAERVSRRKPILALKGLRAAEALRTAGGRRGHAGSHTAAALHGDMVADALFHQAGVLRFKSAGELFDAAEFFECQPLPLGRRVAVVSSSKGVATLAIDACAMRGLLAGRSDDDAPTPWLLGAGARADDYAAALLAALENPSTDAVIVTCVERYGGEPERVLELAAEVSARQDKPVVASIVRADGTLPDRRGRRLPNFLFPEECAEVLSRASERREWLSRPLGVRPSYGDLDEVLARRQIDACLGRTGGAGGWLHLLEAEALLQSHGIEVARGRKCATVEQAVASAVALGGSIALKADFPPPAHAADIDAVLLGLEGETAVRAGWGELQRRVEGAGRTWHGTIVQRLEPPGADVLVGTVSDPDLGSVMAVGLGGRQAGLGGTVAFRLLTTTDVQAEELIAASPPLVAQLEGFRGRPRLDHAALRDLLLRFAQLLRCCPEIVEADLNPVRCMRAGCVVLDMRVRVERRRPRERIKTW